MHCHGGAKLKNSRRTVQVLPECLRLSKVPAVHCSIAIPLGQQEIQKKHHSPDEWASRITSDPKKKNTIHVRNLCCSRAPWAVPQRVPLGRASVTPCSAAWSMAPAGQILLPLQSKTDMPVGRGDRAAKTTKKSTNRNKPTSKCDGRQEGGCVCVMLGPAVLSSP